MAAYVKAFVFLVWFYKFSWQPTPQSNATMYISVQQVHGIYNIYTGLNLGLRPAKEARRYKVTPSLIGGAQT